MSVGSWSPPTGLQTPKGRLESAWLQRFVALARDEQLEQLRERLSTDEQQRMAACLLADPAAWTEAVLDYDDESLWQLMRFLAVAEMQLPGWQAGAKSPVITLNRILKQRGQPLSREQLQWLRQNSDNRFLPNGAL